MLPSASRTLAVIWYVAPVMKDESGDRVIDAAGPAVHWPAAKSTVTGAGRVSPSRPRPALEHRRGGRLRSTNAAETRATATRSRTGSQRYVHHLVPRCRHYLAPRRIGGRGSGSGGSRWNRIRDNQAGRRRRGAIEARAGRIRAGVEQRRHAECCHDHARSHNTHPVALHGLPWLPLTGPWYGPRR